MKKINEKDRATLEGIFQLNQKSILYTMHGFLKNKYKKIIKTKHFLYALGNIPVALVAHCDTVFSETPINIFYDESKEVMWSPEGLGADDRAGIWAIIKIVRAGLRPHIILTTDEEMGGIGAGEFVNRFPLPLEKLKYIIQLDRRGVDDCVFYDCYNEDFIEYVESFGFKENFGTFSDISIICPIWKIAGVNLSIGYQNEHTYTEVLWINHMNRTINKVIKMLNSIEKAPYFEYVENPYVNNYNWKYFGSFPSGTKFQCVKCGKNYDEHDVFGVKMLDGSTKWACIDCIGSFNWCCRCNEPFENTDNNNDLCPDCTEILFGG